MPKIPVAETIIVVTLPEASRVLIQAGKLTEALQPKHFEHFERDDRDAMGEVSKFVEQLTGIQPDLLLDGLQHALGEEHHACVHFARCPSEYDVDGIGLEIKDDTVTEEKMAGPVRVIFITYES